MALKLMYITNNPNVAAIAESYGVDRIFVDMEYIGKSERQGGMDTVQSHHTFDDIKRIKAVLKKSELIVRCNPIHGETKDYCSSKEEIEKIIENGADIVMLPYFKTIEEVKLFLSLVNGKVKTMLLIETPESVTILDEILCLKGIDFIHIGLNDLSLGYNKKFMFELLSNGLVEVLCSKIKKEKIPYGFGGIASLGHGVLPSERIIMEHYRLESSCAILSRSFCNAQQISDIKKIKNTFKKGIRKIRKYEKQCERKFKPFLDNENEIRKKVEEILG